MAAPLVTNQVEFSLLQMAALTDGTLDQCQQLRRAPMAWSPLGGGRLFDEVRSTDLVVLLHKGRVLFTGSVPELLAKTATQTVSDAFRKLTGTGTQELAA